MRTLWKDIAFAVWVGMILPGILMNLVMWKAQYRETAVRAEPKQQIAALEGPEIAVRNPDGTRTSMELDTYLTGVLLAEIPASFHEEALKAQAVAARTYTWKAFSTGGKHGDGSVCTDSACCQAYLGQETYLSEGGYPEHLEKMRKAVSATSSIALFYDGDLIEATYFSSSGGSTESAVAVWGADYPYLQAVSSPEETQEYSYSFTKEEFEDLLGIERMGEESQWLKTVSYTDGGGVDTVEIGGQPFTGVQLRSILGLRSTAFQMEIEEGSIIVTTRGYGHRVGLSQYGANAMAQQGSTWQQILQHYYPGTTLAAIY